MLVNVMVILHMHKTLGVSGTSGLWVSLADCNPSWLASCRSQVYCRLH